MRFNKASMGFTAPTRRDLLAGLSATIGAVAAQSATPRAFAAATADSASGTATRHIIDVHSHPVLPVLAQALERHQGVAPGQAITDGMKLPPWSAEDHIAFMDRHGIQTAILSWTTAPTFLRGAALKAFARSVNEALASIVTKYPTRFGAFAFLPLDDIDAANAEMAYALDVLKLDGVVSSAHVNGAYLGDARYEPWFAEMHRRQTVLFVHPAAPPGLEQVDIGTNPAVLEYMFDTTRMITKLLISGFKSRFRDIKIITTHGGGTIPYIANRLVFGLPFFTAGSDHPLSADDVRSLLGSFYFDLTLATSPAQLFAMSELIPPSRMLMGFDHPFMPEASVEPMIAGVEAFSRFSDEDRRAIYSGNALNLIPRLKALK